MFMVQSIENPIGFNQTMFSIIHWKRTGQWPLLSNTTNVTDSFIQSELEKGRLSELNNSSSSSSNTSSFWDGNSNFI